MLAGISILLVDDSVDNQQLIFRMLNLKGAMVAVANNGAEGVAMALKRNDDIILMDLSMPILDGYSATQKLRERGYKKPIIALTAHAMSDVRARCLHVGFNDHLPKPITPDELYRKIIETHFKIISHSSRQTTSFLYLQSHARGDQFWNPKF